MVKVAGVAVLCFLGAASGVALAEEQPAANEIPKQVLQDDFLDRMVGNWKMTGTFEGQPVNHGVEVDWVLHHQFLRIHERDLDTPKVGEVPYEAIVTVGYERAAKRYVAHWLDVFGGGAVTLGYGERAGTAIEFLFAYPGQPWLTTFRWKPETNSWQWLMQTKTKEGQWAETANMKLAPDSKR
jgi:hypothetical protein